MVELVVMAVAAEWQEMLALMVLVLQLVGLQVLEERLGLMLHLRLYI
jgi:hypothetical protein